MAAVPFDRSPFGRRAFGRALLILAVILVSSPADRPGDQGRPPFAAPSEDRNGNGIPDELEIPFAGDCNNNGIPDDVDTSVHWVNRVLDPATPSANSTFAADLDGDGDMDVLSAHGSPSTAAWYENLNGLGSFSPPRVFGSGSGFGTVHAADLDGDGDNDVVHTRRFDQTVWHENTDGEGDLGPAQVIVGAYRAYDVDAADVDGDGDNDLLVALYQDDEIRWCENLDGAGSFGVALLVATGANEASDVLGTDMDGDGDTDVVFAARDDGTVSWVENLDGNGTWGAERIITAQANDVLSIDVADLDGDDDPDVLVAHFDDDLVTWFRNDNGVFTNAVVVGQEINGATSVSAVDLDNDADLDVVVAAYYGDQIIWFENTSGAGGFGPQNIVSYDADQVFSVFAANLDGDGDTDLVAAIGGTIDRIDWFENIRDDCNNNGVPDSCEDPVVTTDCTDVDFDGVSATADCDDTNPNCTTDCTDADGDGYCATTDCDEINPDCTADCTDIDGDGLCPPADCDDLEDDCTTDCTDGDGDGVAACSGDCDDADPECGSGDCAADCDENGVPDPCDNAVGLMPFDVSDSTALDVFTADLDGDGDRDLLATGSSFPNAVLWYENVDGLGDTWGPANLVVDGGGDAVAAADFDGDGDLDIVAEVAFALSWFANLDGAGNFGPQWFIEPDFGPTSVVPADLDDDGDLDVLATSAFYDRLAWYENADGAGGFALGQLVDFGSSVNGVGPAVVVDLDGDDDLDIVVASSGNDRVSWYENEDGEGSFGSQQLIAESSDLGGSVFAADLDGDDDLDVLASAFNSDSVTWFENTDGVGTFGFGGLVAVVDRPRSVFAADLDGDGDADVLSGGNFGLARSENFGGGSFGPPQMVHMNLVFDVVAANVDGDGDVDLVAGHSSDIRWYENLRRDCNNDGILDSCQDPTVASDCVDLDYDGVNSTTDCNDTNPNCTTDCTDADGDGYCVTTDCDDAISYCTSDCEVCADTDCDGNAVPDATDTSVHFATEVLDAFADEADTIQIADLDGDGDRDLLVGNDSETGLGTIAWYENVDGPGAFGPRQTITNAIDEPVSLFAADLDGDGDRDVVAGEGVDFGLYWYENTLSGIWPEHTIDLEVAGSVSVVAADLDGDGDRDVVAGLRLGNRIVWWRNTGSGSFSPPQVIHEPAPEDPTMVTVADLDGDGDLDVLAAYPTTFAITWHKNLDGDGNFGPQQPIKITAEVASLDVSDVDGDDDLDLVAALPDDDEVGWYENIDGSGTFGPRRHVSFIAAPVWAVAADLDDDGDQDVLSVSPADGILWNENTSGLGEFALPRFVSPDPDSGMEVAAADLDGDGDLDAVSVADTVSWHENLRDDCNANQLPDVCEDPSVTDACTDLDADGFPLTEDCDDDDHTIWADPGPVDGLLLSAHGLPGEAALSWPPPAEPGAASVRYDTLRSTDASDFLDPATVCVESDELDRLAQDDGVPFPGKPHYYLVRVENDCPGSVPAMGTNSDGVPRTGLSCP